MSQETHELSPLNTCPSHKQHDMCELAKSMYLTTDVWAHRYELYWEAHVSLSVSTVSCHHDLELMKVIESGINRCTMQSLTLMISIVSKKTHTLTFRTQPSGVDRQSKTLTLIITHTHIFHLSPKSTGKQQSYQNCTPKMFIKYNTQKRSLQKTKKSITTEQRSRQ